MKLIKDLTVTVTYTVGLGDVEVSDEMFEKLQNLETDTLDTNTLLSDDKSEVMEWLSNTITESDAYEWSYEIIDCE